MLFPRGVKAFALFATLVMVCLGLAAGGVALRGGPSEDAATLVASGQASPPGAVWQADPRGVGTACTTAAPCTADAAVRRAKPGDVVALAPGSYPKLTISATAQRATADTPVLLRPAAGDVQIAGLALKAPGIVLQDLGFTATVYVYPDAVGATLQNLHVDGAGVFLRANGTKLLDSIVENGRNLDGIQVKDGDGILVQGNTVRNFVSVDLHADCLQLFDVKNVVIRGNTLHDCDNAGIIFSGGGGKGIQNVLVESNFVMGCRVKSDDCTGGALIDLREPSAHDVTVRHNTFEGGSVRIEATQGQVNDRNVFDYLSSCSTPMTNSVVSRWNEGLCSAPSALGKHGNRQSDPAFVDAGQVDLHVAEGQREAVTVESVAVSYPSNLGEVLDIDGQAFAEDTAGADEPGDAPVQSDAPAPPTASPSEAPPASSAAPSSSAAPARTSEATPSGTADSTRPQVRLAAVSAESTAGRSVMELTATVTGGRASTVDFSVLGRVHRAGTSTDGGQTWTLRVDTRQVPDGVYPVTATATVGGAQVVSPTERIAVDN